MADAKTGKDLQDNTCGQFYMDYSDAIVVVYSVAGTFIGPLRRAYACSTRQGVL